MVGANGMRIGVVGVGRIGTFHARTLQALEGVSSVLVTDSDAARVTEVAEALRVTAIGSPQELVEAGVDALVIATATPSHAPLLRLAAAAGLPAFCEKPVATDLGELDELIAEIDAAGTLVQIGFQRRFDAGIRRLRDRVASGVVGDLLVVRATSHDEAPPSEEYLAQCGGIFCDVHVHDFDAIRFVSGREIVEVYADGAVREAAWMERYDDVDTSVLVLRLDGGALAVVTGSRHDPIGYDVRLEVLGTADSMAAGLDIRTPLRSVELGSSLPDSPYRGFLDRFENAYREEMAAFVDAVRRRGPSPCSLADARAALRVARAAARSRVERRPVAVADAAVPAVPGVTTP